MLGLRLYLSLRCSLWLGLRLRLWCRLRSGLGLNLLCSRDDVLWSSISPEFSEMSSMNSFSEWHFSLKDSTIVNCVLWRWHVSSSSSLHDSPTDDQSTNFRICLVFKLLFFFHIFSNSTHSICNTQLNLLYNLITDLFFEVSFFLLKWILNIDTFFSSFLSFFLKINRKLYNVFHIFNCFK